MAAYEEFPIETDPATLALDAFAWLATRWPGWTANSANFDAGTIEANAQMAAEVRDVAASVPDSIFRRFGTLAGIPALDAVAASMTVTVTAIDNLGYTLEAGTVFGLRATGDTIYLFSVDNDVVIAPGSTSTAVGGVALTAQEAGAGPNGLGTPGTVLIAPVDRTLPWLNTAVTVTAASGGSDAEDDATFLNRLTEELRLSAPRPIVAGSQLSYDPNVDDFAAFAKRDPAVTTAISFDLYQPGTNEVQTVSHTQASGTGTLTFSGQTTAAIAFNATADTIRLALEALSNVAPGDVTVTGGPWPAAVTITFLRAWGEQNVPAITGTFTGLAVTTTTGGVAPATNVAKSVTVWVKDASGLDPGQTARDRIAADLLARRESGFQVFVRAPYYDSVSVTWAAKAYPGWDPADVQARGNQAVTDWLSPATFTAPPFSEVPMWLPTGGLLRLGELVQVLNSVDGLWYLTGPGANGMPTVNGSAADYTLVGPAQTLPIAGTIAGTVTS